MADAMRMAREALLRELEESPAEIERRAQERARKDALARAAQEQRRVDAGRLERSPLQRWFPDCEWAVKGHYAGGTVFGTGPDTGQGAHMRLLVTERRPQAPIPTEHDGATIEVRFAEYEDWDKASDDHGRGQGARERYGNWKGPVVRSVADVGRQIDKQDAVQRSMPAHLP